MTWLSRRLESLMLTLVVIAAAAWRYGATVADRDLWGHIRFGQDKIAAGGYIATDSYGYLTDGQTWFNHEWLAEVVMAATYDGLGAPGLALLKALVALGVTGLLVWWLIKKGVPPTRASILSLLAVVVLTPTFGTFRPQMFTVVLFVVLVFVILGVERGRRHLLWIVPVLMALWVNLHGGVVAGLSVFITWAVLYALVERGKGRWWPLVAGVAGLAASGLHPLGYRHLWFLVRTTTVPRPEIQDWQPVDLASVVGLAYVLLVVAMGLALWSGRHSVRVPIVVPLGALALAPLVSTRHLQLFAPALFLLGGTYLASVFKRDEPPPSRTIAATSLGVVVSLIASTFAVGVTVAASDCVEVDASQFEFPTRAVHALAGMEGEAIVPFNWGEYIIWHLGPGMRVSIDGRRETVYGDEVLGANLDFINGDEDWERLLDMGSPDLAIVPSQAPVVPLLEGHPGWRIAYEDPIATILARIPSGSLRVQDTLPVDGDGLCFPA